MKHKWNTEWSAVAAEHQGHTAITSLKRKFRIFGFALEDSQTLVKQIGPLSDHISFATNFCGLTMISGIVVNYFIPLGPKRIRLIHHFFTNNSCLRFPFIRYVKMEINSMVS